MPIEPMDKHYSMVNPASVYDEEAMTALELAGRTAAKMNETVRAFNNLEDDTTANLTAQNTMIRELIDKTVPETIAAEVDDHIENGDFDAAIDKYAGELSDRLDNLLNSTPNQPTTMDAEIIDVRIAVDGTSYPNAGTATRTQLSMLRGVVGKNRNTRVNLVEYTETGFYTGGGFTEEPSFRHSNPIYLQKGDRVYSSCAPHYGTNRACYLVENGNVKLPVAPDTSITAYNVYDIPRDGYYVFNLKSPGYMGVSFTPEGINVGQGLYVPDNIVNVDELAKRIDTFERVNLVKEYRPGYADSFTLLITQQSGSNYVHSQPIYLREGDTVYVPDYTGSYGSNVFFFSCDLDGKPIKAFALEKINDVYRAIAPVDGLYLFNGLVHKDYPTFSVTRTADAIGTPIGATLPGDAIGVCENPLYGKKIAFEGDSICAGAGFSGGYGKIIADENGMIYVNTAKGGGTIAPNVYDGGEPRHCIHDGLRKLPTDSDYVIFEGGVNDASLGGDPGVLPEGYDVLDIMSFFGAFDSCLATLHSRFAGKKVGFIFPHSIFDASHEWNTVYRPSMIKLLEKWGVPYLDLQKLAPPLNHTYSLKAAYTANGDGWHPNEAGYRAFYVDKITAWLKTL